MQEGHLADSFSKFDHLPIVFFGCFDTKMQVRKFVYVVDVFVVCHHLSFENYTVKPRSCYPCVE